MIKKLSDFFIPLAMMMVLILMTHLIAYIFVSTFIEVPAWLYHTMFFVIGLSYVLYYVFNSIRIDIVINGVLIVHYKHDKLL